MPGTDRRAAEELWRGRLLSGAWREADRRGRAAGRRGQRSPGQVAGAGPSASLPTVRHDPHLDLAVVGGEQALVALP
ncbi:hypothetical protein NCC78_24735, partial [Micromonospora phytophila]|uniref:hypothetical protein n=1 Tax=Micromonospora phytophila TaxID=709888 RepID=UPI0020301910